MRINYYLLLKTPILYTLHFLIPVWQILLVIYFQSLYQLLTGLKRNQICRREWFYHITADIRLRFTLPKFVYGELRKHTGRYVQYFPNDRLNGTRIKYTELSNFKSNMRRHGACPRCSPIFLFATYSISSSCFP